MFPNCHYCGKFVNPLKEGIGSDIVSDPLINVDVIYYHQSCKQKQIMNTPISPELSDRISKEAEAFAWNLREHRESTSNYADLKTGYIAGATAYAPYKEKWERIEANLKYISTQIGKVELNEQNMKLIQEANNAINFAMAGADYTQTFSQNTLATWKEEKGGGV